MKQFLDKYSYHLLFAAIFIVYFINMFIDIMDIDAAQYALISMEMSWTKSFLQVYQQGQDYLDKPPLLFWLSSLSFILFDISNFAYKLPSVLIAILGIYSTYKFARLWYSNEKAIVSALILASCQALFLITNDVRTDTNLLGLSMFAIWQLSAYLQQPKWSHLILASIGISFAMMAKGPIALIIPIAAFGTDLLIKRQWKNIFKWQWLLLLVLIALFLIPMSYGLYTQFDLHPEKTVYGLQGPSGLRFFYWTQSFGRITGENYWQNDTSPLFFTHTILWDLQPWVLLFIPALIFKIGQLIMKMLKGSQTDEYITLGGFIMVFIALSMSKYKLPHYIFVLFPFAAIITADFILDLNKKLQTRISKIQFGIMHLFWLLMVVCFVMFFPPSNIILPIILLALYAVNIIVFIRLKDKPLQMVIPTIITAIAFNLLMGLHFYPHLLKYQAPSQAGQYVTEHQIPNDKFYCYKAGSFSLDFYARRITPKLDMDGLKNAQTGTYIYTSIDNLADLDTENIPYKTIETFDSFGVTRLKLSFLNSKTRHQTTGKQVLIELQ